MNMGPIQQLGAHHWFCNIYCFQLLKGSKTVGKDLHSLLLDLDEWPDMQLLIASCLTHLCFVEEEAGQGKLTNSCCRQVQHADAFSLVFKIMFAALEVWYELIGNY